MVCTIVFWRNVGEIGRWLNEKMSERGALKFQF